MRFKGGWRLALGGVLLWGSIAAAQDRSSEITVLVNDSAGWNRRS